MRENVKDIQVKRGQTYFCSICGAETLVIRAGKGGKLRPVCCNQPMVVMEKSTHLYRCPVCGSEVAVLTLKSDDLKLICCNVPMQVLGEKAA